LKCAIQTVVIVVLGLAAIGYGYGGLDFTAGFPDFSGLKHHLDSLNKIPLVDSSGVGGSSEFTYSAPLWWYGGHGGGQVGVVTLGGSGAFTVRSNHADSLGCELAGIRAEFEAGYPYAPVEWFWLRPCLGLAGTGLVVYAHSVEYGYGLGNFREWYKRWYAAWTFSAAPGLEVMGALPTGQGSYVGLFAKASYLMPMAGPGWFGDDAPPRFSPNGFALQIGVRLGKTFFKAEEEEEEEDWSEQ